VKIITVPEKFLTAEGKPFWDGKLDEDGKPVPKRDEKKNMIVSIQTIGKEQVAIPEYEQEKIGYLAVLKNTIEIIRRAILMEKADKKELPGLTFEDTDNGVQIYRAINVSDGVILELEQTPHKWLIENLKKYGPNTIGFNTPVILEPLETAADGASNRAERRRESKAK
jgi:hypothetical protein